MELDKVVLVVMTSSYIFFLARPSTLAVIGNEKQLSLCSPSLVVRFDRGTRWATHMVIGTIYARSREWMMQFEFQG